MRHYLFVACIAAFAAVPQAAAAKDFDIAHLREQGQDMIVIPLGDDFEFKGDKARSDAAYYLQRCASGAGLAGDVVLVWSSNASMKFMAPHEWRSFFEHLDMQWVAKRINKTLTCR